jgi:uncharacterized protein YceH (UPF0502 family)
MQASDATHNAPQWQPLSAVDRRVAGALVEKAKTTPAAYPMTLNSLRTASNQKSNRYPMMQLEEDDVAQSLEHLRSLGAVIEVQGDGRVPKYRHLLYDWLGVDKVEMAVMAELLLRGAQTVGELRGRAARMEPIADLSALQPILASLKAKKLIVYLTPEGRGCVVTHALYRPQELEKLRLQYSGAASQPAPASPQPPPAAHVPTPAAHAASTADQTAAPAQPAESASLDKLSRDVEQLRAENAELREQLDRMHEDLRRDIDDIREQLGI